LCTTLIDRSGSPICLQAYIAPMCEFAITRDDCADTRRFTAQCQREYHS
jgi:hypothetical protein